MTIPIPLAVRVVTTRQDIHITNRLAELSFRTVFPGGFASARISLHAPLRFQPAEIVAFGRVYIYDARNGSTVWEGRLEDPGRAASMNGEVYEVSALGPSTHARDRTTPLVYVDSRLSTMYTSATSGRAYSVGTRESANAANGALNISASRGSVVTQLSLGAATYDMVYIAGQDLGRIYFDWDGGFDSANTQVQLRTTEDLGGTTTITSTNIALAGGSLVAELGGSPAITANHNRVILTNRRSGADLNPVTDDNYWAEFFNMAIVATRFLKDGTAKTSGYTTNTVLASEVVEDLLGRLLPEYDGANGSITTTTYPIEHLVYMDGASAEKVFADLMGMEPTFGWEALETNPATGKNRFNWRQWPATVRYEAGIEDGFTAPGSVGELFNEVVVRYRDSLGQIRWVTRTQTVPVLTDASKTRGGFIDLGDEVSTEDNAIQIGDTFLAEHLYAPASGRLTVARPILDTVAGRMVMPWELRPGYLIRLRDLNPRPAVLDATARDGESVFKVVAVDYNTGDATAQLDLDAPAPSVAQMLVDNLVSLPSTPKTFPIRRR